MTKLTKQGMPDLNQGRSNPSRKREHRCFFVGPLVVVGDHEGYAAFAQRCFHCGKPGRPS